MLQKIDTCQSNPEKSLLIKISKHSACGHSLFTHCSFDTTKIKHDYYRSKDCKENFSRDLKKHATEIMNHKKGNDTINKQREQIISQA